ncbi:hypothetical protein MLD38_020926 [Melastoma candidum]|uniref:Uncharacterized protein n=1 Tax=Melastoma candidum TaxID=119954 RepID=A0ACB9QIA4_9MYRT|nr:hypothetical protein MLD38_020926 [Melastoma candidum]
MSILIRLRWMWVLRRLLSRLVYLQTKCNTYIETIEKLPAPSFDPEIKTQGRFIPAKNRSQHQGRSLPCLARLLRFNLGDWQGQDDPHGAG